MFYDSLSQVLSRWPNKVQLERLDDGNTMAYLQVCEDDRFNYEMAGWDAVEALKTPDREVEITVLYDSAGNALGPHHRVNIDVQRKIDRILFAQNNPSSSLQRVLEDFDKGRYSLNCFCWIFPSLKQLLFDDWFCMLDRAVYDNIYSEWQYYGFENTEDVRTALNDGELGKNLRSVATCLIGKPNHWIMDMFGDQLGIRIAKTLYLYHYLCDDLIFMKALEHQCYPQFVSWEVLNILKRDYQKGLNNDYGYRMIPSYQDPITHCVVDLSGPTDED